MSTVRVLMVSERWFPSVGGGEYHILHLVRGLTAHGIEVDLVSRDLRGTVRPPGSDGLDGFRVVRLPPRSAFENPLGRSLYAPLLVRTARRLDPPDLIHVHCPLGSFPAAYLRRRRGIPLVRTLHGVYRGQWERMLGRSAKAPLYAAVEALSLSLAYEALVSVDRRSLGEGLPGVHPRPQWIPNGVDAARFESGPSEKRDPVTFLFVGRMVPQKGLVHLLEASRHLEAEGVEFRVLLVGEGPERRALERRSRALQLRSPRFLGTLPEEELTTLYKSAHAFVLPSLWEGLPLTLLEAWAAHLPVVATAVGGVTDVAEEGTTALLVPPGDSGALATRMQRLIEDPGLRHQLGSAGHRLVRDQFGWDHVVEETIALYESCLGAQS